MLQDLRHTMRSLSRSAGFTAAAIATIALGIGVNTSVFSIVHGTLLSPLPYPNPDRLTFIWKDLTEANYPRAPLSGPEVADLRKGASLHESIGTVWATSGTLVEDNRPEPLRLAMVTSNFLSVLGVQPVRGRSFTTADEKPGSLPSIIISGALWQSRFGGSDVIGRNIRIDGGWGMDGGRFVIAGVMPVGFEMLLPLEANVPKAADAWIPFPFDISWAPPGLSYMRTVGRLAPGANLSDARQQIESVGADIVKRFGRPRRFYAEPLHGDLVRQARPALLALQAAVAFVLLIACANVASLLTVRLQTRRKEIGVRAAVGASRWRLVRLLFMESLLLAAAGGLLGIGLAYLGLRLLPLLDTGALPRVDAVGLSGPVLAFSVLATLVSGFLFGIAPLFEWRRADLLLTFKTAARSTPAAPARTRSVLVLAEIGLSVVLVIGAGLLIRSFLNLQAVNTGFRSERVLTFQLSLPPERYGNPAALARFTRALETELRGVAGVEAVGAINQLPLDDVPNWTTAYLVGGADPDRGAPEADARLTTPGYFAAMGSTLVAGRWFTTNDDETQSLVLIVDERLARTAWPGQNALEQELVVRVWTEKGFQPRRGRVVGVIRHIRHHRLSEEVREQIFAPFAQAPRPQMGVLVRASTEDVETLTRALASRLGRIDPDLAPARVQPLDAYVARSRAPARFSMVLATLFGALSLLLACVGLYGVISYSVAQRTSELGVRAALGASRRDILRLVLQQGIVLTAAGVVLGLIGSALVTRWLTSLLFGVTASDPLTFIGVPLVLGLTALAASYAPARRAVSIDAAQALRAE